MIAIRGGLALIGNAELARRLQAILTMTNNTDFVGSQAVGDPFPCCQCILKSLSHRLFGIARAESARAEPSRDDSQKALYPRAAKAPEFSTSPPPGSFNRGRARSICRLPVRA